ncbi:MAG: peptide chain release factor 2 [Armatimonas sp.]
MFDLPRRERELSELEAKAAEPTLWDDPATAQKVMQRLAAAKAGVDPYYALRQRAEDSATLIEMAEAEDDPSAYAEEIKAEIAAIKEGIVALENATLLSGSYDSTDAILELKPGAGGTEACDWAQMLLRMYLRWAEKNGFTAEIHDEFPGEVAGISSATVFISGPNAYGMLKSEHGVHRLVRISPFNAAGKRQTSFAAVEVLPKVEDAGAVVIDDKDIKMDVYRASGAGGQHVNKTSSAVRLTHLPTNIVVTCQNERSQLQNREVAMQVLRSKLAEVQAREEEKKIAALRGEQRNIEWGSQIRSYVFQPYTMVKDLRSGVAIGDIQRVMDGELEELQLGYLRWLAGKGGDGGGEDIE